MRFVLSFIQNIVMVFLKCVSEKSGFEYFAIKCSTNLWKIQIFSWGLRWLNRVMQDHEARASDLNRKLIFSFFFAIFLIRATET